MAEAADTSEVDIVTGDTKVVPHGECDGIFINAAGIGVVPLGNGLSSLPVGPGDAILIPPGTRHTIRNIGRESLVFLCCCAPPYSDEDTVLVD
jgi:mannose-6-phosphate isomerase-like protein (cupin superfamily)